MFLKFFLLITGDNGPTIGMSKLVILIIPSFMCTYRNNLTVKPCNCIIYYYPFENFKLIKICVKISEILYMCFAKKNERTREKVKGLSHNS